MNVGEWIKVAIGDYKAIGYVSKIKCESSQIEVIKVARMREGKLKWSKPTQGSYAPHLLKPIGTLLDDFQDKSALIDISLDTKDKSWFKELTEGTLVNVRS